MLDAWLNLSHREKASELVIVRAIAITARTWSASHPASQSVPPFSATFSDFTRKEGEAGGRGGGGGRETTGLTDERQPDEHEAHQGQHGQGDPQQRLGVVGEPEEAAVGRVDGLCAGLAALKHPLGVARRGVHLVPPAQPDQPAAGDVLDVVEVGGEQEDRDDEDEDAVGGRVRARQHRYTYTLSFYLSISLRKGSSSSVLNSSV